MPANATKRVAGNKARKGTCLFLWRPFRGLVANPRGLAEDTCAAKFAGQTVALDVF